MHGPDRVGPATSDAADAAVDEAVKRALELVPDGVLIADHEGRIAFANARMQHMLGHPADELQGELVEMLLPERYRSAHVGHRQMFVSHAQPREMGAGRSLVALHRDGREVPVEISLSPMYNPGGPLVLATLRDVTRRREVETDLRHFAAFACHDLQAPLRHMRMTLSLLRRRPDMNGDVTAAVAQMDAQAARMSDLMDALLWYEDVRSSEALEDVVDLAEVVERVLATLGPDIEAAQAAIDVASLGSVRGDARLIFDVFQNLIQNAIRHRHAERPPMIRISGRQRDMQVHVTVADNGGGIEPGKEELVFEAFQRLGSRRPGSGIGLAVCRRIVERHGGRIWAETDRAEGAAFHFVLPAADPLGDE